MPSVRPCSFLLIGDLHIGDLHPECRTDSYLDTLLEKLSFIDQIKVDFSCWAGDLVDHWKQSPEVLNRVLSVLPSGKFRFAVPGQHDLPNHADEEIERSTYQTLIRSGRFQTVFGTPINMAGIDVYGAGWEKKWPKPRSGVSLLITHIPTWQKAYIPGEPDGHAQKLLERSAFDIILTGDNHTSFICQDGNRILVNCGSVMRMRADQMDHKPHVVKVTASPDLLLFEKVFLPIKEGVVVREHIEKVQEHEARMTAFVTRLKEAGEVSLSFRDNLEAFLQENKISKDVVNEIRKATEQEG